MRTIMQYLRQCFCKHELEFDEVIITQYDFYNRSFERTKVSQTCKKCGYHKSYWKF